MGFFKTKINYNELVQTYANVVNFVYNDFQLQTIQNFEKIDFLFNIYSSLYFGTADKLKRKLNTTYYINFSKDVCKILFGQDIFDISYIETKLSTNWNRFFGDKKPVFSLLKFNLEKNHIFCSDETIMNYSIVLLNNINATNNFLDDIKIIN